MKRFLLLLALLPAFALAKNTTKSDYTTVPLSVGGTTINFPLSNGYVRASVKTPEVFAVTAAAVGTQNRLIESFYTQADARRVTSGALAEDVFYAVQVFRELEGKQISAGEWAQAKPGLAAQMGSLDMNAIMRDDAAGMNQRVRAVSQQDVDIVFGQMGRPMVYGADAESIRFMMVLPVSFSTAGQTVEVKLAAAGAVLHVRNKVIFVYTYQQYHAPADLERVRQTLGTLVTRTLAVANKP